jgi:hypothetical protein
MWYGIIQLVGLVAGWIIYFLAFGYVFASASSLNIPQGASPAVVSAALGPVFQELTLFFPISLAIGLASIIVLIIGFREFKKVDQPRFSLPSKLIYLLAIGVVIAGTAAALIFNQLPAIIAQAPSPGGGTPSSAFLSSIANLLVFGLLALVGGIIALIGLIGGEILGLWRVGTRYNETVIKLGAIFIIIPLLNVVAPILIIIGANQAKGRLGSGV